MTTFSLSKQSPWSNKCFLSQLLRNSQAQNSRLKIELKALESMLESAKFQLASTKEKVCLVIIDNREIIEHASKTVNFR